MKKSSNRIPRAIAGIVCGAVGGGAFILAFPPFEIWPLIFVGWVPVLVAQHRIMPAKLSSLPVALAIGIWLQGYLGPVFNPIGTYMVYLPLAAAVISFFTDMSKRRFSQTTHYRWFVLEGAVSWAAIEMIRLFIPFAGTWGFIAYPLYRQTWFIQPVSIFGIIGLSALIMIVNLVLALIVISWLDRRAQEAPASIVPQTTVRRWAVGALVALVAWTGLSLILYRPAEGPLTRVAAIQPESPPIVAGNSGAESMLASLHNAMMNETRAVAQDGASFVVWPEGTLQFDPQVDDRLNLASLAQQTGVHLALGYVVPMEHAFRNEATVVSPSGEFLGVFGKDHPVVFGGETSPTRGTYPVYETPVGTLGTIICYDLDYTDTARKLAAQGAQLIGVPSNDWGSIADKHYTHVVFRAIENRVAMVKADGGFDSVIVDPYGRIEALASYPEGGGAVLVADVLLGSGAGTLNTRLGDWIGWLGLAGLAFFIVGESSLKKLARRRHGASHPSKL
ncbi:MAG: apolipoprotein N-acyltransferase [bacterium]